MKVWLKNIEFSGNLQGNVMATVIFEEERDFFPTSARVQIVLGQDAIRGLSLEDVGTFCIDSARQFLASAK